MADGDVAGGDMGGGGAAACRPAGADLWGLDSIRDTPHSLAAAAR